MFTSIAQKMSITWNVSEVCGIVPIFCLLFNVLCICTSTLICKLWHTCTNYKLRCDIVKIALTYLVFRVFVYCMFMLCSSLIHRCQHFHYIFNFFHKHRESFGVDIKCSYSITDITVLVCNTLYYMKLYVAL